LIILFIVERTECNLFSHYLFDRNVFHANDIRKDDSRLHCEKQNRLDLSYGKEIRVIQNAR